MTRYTRKAVLIALVVIAVIVLAAVMLILR